MDTKKKAIRLYRKYSHILDGDYLVTHSQIIEMCILCVDEILKVVPQDDGNCEFVYSDEQVEWMRVKEHLNNM